MKSQLDISGQSTAKTLGVLTGGLETGVYLMLTLKKGH